MGNISTQTNANFTVELNVSNKTLVVSALENVMVGSSVSINVGFAINGTDFDQYVRILSEIAIVDVPVEVSINIPDGEYSAASIAFKEGVANAAPVLLEPIVTLRATVNDDAMGDIIGDINRRRGRVLGMNPTGDGIQEIIAEVPEAEMSTFSTSMRQITQGRGSFTTEFARYERVPEHIAQKVINESKDE